MTHWLICAQAIDEETTPTFYDIRQTTTTLRQRKINWFGESCLLEFDGPLTEPGASRRPRSSRGAHGRRHISTDLGQRRQLVDTRTLERTYVDGDTIKMTELAASRRL